MPCWYGSERGGDVDEDLDHIREHLMQEWTAELERHGVLPALLIGVDPADPERTCVFVVPSSDFSHVVEAFDVMRMKLSDHGGRRN